MEGWGEISRRRTLRELMNARCLMDGMWGLDLCCHAVGLNRHSKNKAKAKQNKAKQTKNKAKTKLK
jgi:hypothetical protein